LGEGEAVKARRKNCYSYLEDKAKKNGGIYLYIETFELLWTVEALKKDKRHALPEKKEERKARKNKKFLIHLQRGEGSPG